MKISVIIPYNKDRGFLSEAVESFCRQDYTDSELIMSQSENTVGFNINRGIEKCNGDLITYLCDDDKLPERALSIYAENYSGWDFCHANAINFRPETSIFQRPEITDPTIKQLLNFNHIHGGTVCYHRRLFDDGLVFDESLWTAEEYDFNLMLLSKGKKLHYINDSVYLYRLHNQQKSRILRLKNSKREEAITQIKRRYL